MEVIRETLWKRCLSTPTKPPAKNSNICLSEKAYQHKGTRKKCKKTNQGAITQWQRQCLMDKPHRKPRPKSKTSDISKQSPSPLHHTFLLGRARFTAQPLSALANVTARPWSRDILRFAGFPWKTFVYAKFLRPMSCCHSTFLLFFTVKCNDSVSFSFLFPYFLFSSLRTK